MGAKEPEIICEGVLEKKVTRRRFSIGSVWKRKYCVLNTDALLMYRSKTRMDRPSRTVPLCHMKSANRLCEDNLNKVFYFNIITEQGETLLFRCKHDRGWAALIQIQLIHYKNRQDMLRYKQLANSTPIPAPARQRRCANENHPNPQVTLSPEDEEKIKNTPCPKGCKAVILPVNKASRIGIGITVIPLPDGRIVVNRVIDGGPAMKLGDIRSHDEIISANGHPVDSVQMLSEVVRKSPETIILVIKPRIVKPSPILDNPKQWLKEGGGSTPKLINTTLSKDENKDFAKELRRPKSSPKHFRFS